MAWPGFTEAFIYMLFFLISVVFPLVIHSSISIFYIYSFISVANMCVCRWSFKPKSVFLSRPMVFQFAIFLSVALSPSGCIFARGPSLSLCNSVSMLFIHSAFFYDFSVPIFLLQNLLSLSHPVVNMDSPIFLLIVARIFSIFSKFLFCLYFLVLSQYRFSLPSFGTIFGWSPRVFF